MNKLGIVFLALIWVIIGIETVSSGTIYTANEISNTISVIDTATGKVDTVLLGDEGHHQPLYNGHIDIHGMMPSPDGRMLLVTGRGSSTVVAIDTQTKKIMGYVLPGREPHVATFTPDGREAWVTVRGENYISVIDPKNMKITGQIPTVNGPSMVIFSQDGKLAFIASQREPALAVIDVSFRKTVTLIPVPSRFSPFLMLSPDGNEVWVTHKDTSQVSIISVKEAKLVKTFPVGKAPNHLAFVQNAKGRFVYVTIAKENVVEVYEQDGGNRQIVRIAVGEEPHGIWPNEDGSKLYVGHEKTNDVRVIDTATNKIIATYAVGKKPIDVVYLP